MAGSSATARRPPAPRASKASTPSLPKPAAPAGFPHVRPVSLRSCPAGGRGFGCAGRRRNRRRWQPPSRPRRAIEHVRPLRATCKDRLRRRLAELRGTAAFKTTVTIDSHPQDHHPQRFARYFLRSLDQSVSGLRARLHLLLRTADTAYLGSVAGSRFRIQAFRQARCAELLRAHLSTPGYSAAYHRHRHQHRSLPADRAGAPGDAAAAGSAGPLRPSGRHRALNRRWFCVISTFSCTWRNGIS